MENLTNKSIEELRDIARSLGIKPHHKAKAETLVYQIMQQPKSSRQQPMSHAAEASVTPAITNTPEQIMDAIKEYAAKEGFVADFKTDNTVIFKYKGAEDSCNLSIPLRVIKQRAALVARGRIAPRSLGTDRTYIGYADNILAG